MLIANKSAAVALVVRKVIQASIPMTTVVKRMTSRAIGIRKTVPRGVYPEIRGGRETAFLVNFASVRRAPLEALKNLRLTIPTRMMPLERKRNSSNFLKDRGST